MMHLRLRPGVPSEGSVCGGLGDTRDEINKVRCIPCLERDRGYGELFMRTNETLIPQKNTEGYLVYRGRRTVIEERMAQINARLNELGHTDPRD